jgi:hypothetical protein
VLPLWWPTSGGCACGKLDCQKNVGKHPLSRAVPNGLDGATMDAELIRAWWARWPAANVGIRTGLVSGLVVVDVDPRHGGDDGFADLETRHGALPESPLAHTGGGGSHLFLAHPGVRPVTCRTNLGGFPGVDLKADGGYVVAPPSRHGSGRIYTWHKALHLPDVPLAPCPDAILALALEGPSAARVRYEPAPWDGRLPERAARLLERGRRLRDRFGRDASGLADPSPSGVDASLATLAALAGLSAQDVEATVRASRARAGLPPRGTSYYAATVGKAMALAAERDASVRRLESRILASLRRA